MEAKIYLWWLIPLVEIGVVLSAKKNTDWPAKMPPEFVKKSDTEGNGIFFEPPLQSPVDIRTKDAQKVNFTDLKMQTKLRRRDECVERTNKSGIVEFNVNTCNSKPILSGGPLEYYDKSEFVFNEMHFHWGPKDLLGSEHSIDGKRFAMEVHCTFVNRKYKNKTEQEERKKRDGIAVLAVFIDVQEKNNSDAQKMIDYIERKKTGEKITVYDAFNWISSSLTLNDYYTYPGSLTLTDSGDPECVTWMVFPDAVYLSRDQIRAFAQSGERDKNYKEQQAMNDRPFLHC